MKKNRPDKKTREIRVVRGSGTVFSDLGFKPRQAVDLRVKAELSRQIYNRISALALTQTQASQRLGISQPDVSKLMNGRFNGYSTDRLIALLNALDMDVDIIVRPRKSTLRHRSGAVKVINSAAA